MAQKRNLTKEKIIKTAFILADEIGINQLTFPKLAEKLDIKYPSLYNHFNNMDDLKTEMTVSFLKELNLNLIQKIVGKSGSDAIIEFAYTYKKFAFENKTAYGLFMSIPNAENEKVHSLVKEIGGIIRQILAFYIKDQTYLIHKSRALRSMLHGFISLSFLNYFRNKADLDDSFNFMIEDFIFSFSRE